ncbi:sulfatase [Pullulanibacillus camelliae]|uniref:Sulfatase n=1 Tax=Pullulanibacillus camelliae TaxID=1707096 RepID=A0A8J2Y9L7_9BACL|nr:sulfatase-like hydrolase/transferase [Pullulanibacillus camelliae]GGE26031.1 sulfatase [Pullulanibacillus camelliae]
MTNRPNILLITTDQQHWNTIHALGNETISTPNLDQLTKDGVSFMRTYVTNPVCSPSRSSILTGQYPSRHKCWNIGVELDENCRTLSSELSKAGYNTGLFGKAHFKPVLNKESFEAPPNIHDREFWKNWNGPYYGFETVAMVHGHADEDSSHGMHYGAWLEEQGVDPSQYFGPGGGHREGSWDIPEELHYTRWTADQTINYIKQSKEAPFFAWCSFQDPHNAFLCPEPWNSLYDPDNLPAFNAKEGEMMDKPSIHQHLIAGKMDELDVETTSDPGHDTGGIQCLGHTNKTIGIERAKRWLAAYYGMISLMDHHLGRVVKTLKEENLLENTMIIFTSDHGDYAGNHGLWLKGPIHYEDVIRVPFVVSWPETLPKDVKSESLISLADLAPTLLDICGIDPLPEMQGMSQKNIFKNPNRSERDWCLVENRAEPNFYVKTLVMNEYKMNYYLNRAEGELYHLTEDPYEYKNLFNDPRYKEIKNQMFMKLIDVYAELEGPYPERMSFA